ncbi:MAG: ABC transporter permease [Anaerolineae bacterium]|nr:ABC transporter permease [Anaerolineae bacterium]
MKAAWLERLRALRGLVGAGTPPDDAWIDSDVALTPREARLRQAATLFQWGAAAHGVAVLVLLLALAAGAGAALRGLLLAGYTGPDDTALLLILPGLLINCGVLLLLAVGTLAQEFWLPVLLALALLANGLALALVGFTPALLLLLPALWAARRLLPDRQAFHINPVAAIELRGRMRGARAFAIITVFLTMMGSFTVLLYLLQLPAVAGGRTIITGELGRILFTGVVAVELLMIIFIVPALTAGAVTGERERKTYDLLQTTLLSAPAFIVGKMEAALGYILLLLLSAIPLQSIAFLFGGISEFEVLLAFVILAVTAVLLAALGLFFSSLTERTLTATVRVYTLALAVVFALPVVSLVLLRQAFGQAVAGVAVGGASPLLEALTIYLDMLIASVNPVTAAYYTGQMLINQGQVTLMQVQLQTTGGTIPVLSPWILLTVGYLVLAALLILLAVRRMRRSGGS